MDNVETGSGGQPDWDLEYRFSYYPPTNLKAVEAHEAIREDCKRLAYTLKKNMPSGREASLALTNLEQTMFWANAAIARNNA